MPRLDTARIVREITALCEDRPPISLMEVCGTHTVSLFRSGAKSLLPDELRLISGPGCPVCVTSQGYIDTACELAARSDVTIATYGDMVRVPGAKGSLEKLRGAGAEVAVLSSARDALSIAARNPKRRVVFLAVGFETTTPASAAMVLEAAIQGLDNLSILPGHKLVVPAMELLLSGGDVPVDGFLCPGHVSVVIGAEAYRPIVENYAKPCVVAGFEFAGMLEAIRRLVFQVREGEAKLENAYTGVVGYQGNPHARHLTDQVFEAAPAVWRAMGSIPASGLELRPRFRRFDAREVFGVDFGPDVHPPGCLCGEVIQGKTQPAKCALFGEACTPLNPIGPCMVSSEGTCSAWYKYGRATPGRGGVA